MPRTRTTTKRRLYDVPRTHLNQYDIILDSFDLHKDNEIYRTYITQSTNSDNVTQIFIVQKRPHRKNVIDILLLCNTRDNTIYGGSINRIVETEFNRNRGPHNNINAYTVRHRGTLYRTLLVEHLNFGSRDLYIIQSRRDGQSRNAVTNNEIYLTNNRKMFDYIDAVFHEMSNSSNRQNASRPTFRLRYGESGLHAEEAEPEERILYSDSSTTDFSIDFSNSTTSTSRNRYVRL